MPSEQLVDVTYRGLDVGQGLRLSQVGPGSAHLACDAPLPVGTALVLAVAGGPRIPARVLRVHESAEALPLGMRIGVIALDDEARAWWEDLVTVDDQVIPEPAQTRATEDGPAADAPARELEAEVAEVEAEAVVAGEPAEVAAAGEDATSGEADVSGETDEEVMAVAAEEIPEDGGSPEATSEAVTEAAGKDEMRAAELPEEADQEADASNKAKGKKRRRRSRNRR